MEVSASQTVLSQAKSSSRLWWWAMAIAGVVLVLGLVAGFLVWSKPMDPYVKGVLELTGDVDRGGDIFLMNCSTCHGFDATGRVGPSLQGVGDRKSQQQLIHQVVSGKTPPMPQFQPDTQDMADLLSYLQTL